MCVSIARTVDDEYEYDKNHDRWMIDDKHSRHDKIVMMIMMMTTNIVIFTHLEEPHRHLDENHFLGMRLTFVTSHHVHQLQKQSQP